MEDIGHVVKEVVARCEASKVIVSEVLAAFVLKTVSTSPQTPTVLV